MSSHVDRQFHAKSPRARHGSGGAHSHRARPCLEQLEGRLAPATFNVNTLADTEGVNLVTGQDANGNISLRSAISAANATAGGNTIDLTVAGVYRITIAGTGEENNQAGDFDILAGSGGVTFNNTSGGKVAVDAAGLDRVFDINPTLATTAFTVVFNDMTIENGRAVSAANPDGPDATGGGIRDQGNANLTLTNVVVTNNSATADGGGVGMEDTVNSTYTLTVNNCTISNNHAGDAGGGIDTDGTGTVIINSGTVITGNTDVNQGAGVYLDAIGPATANLTVTGTLISGNSSMGTVNGLGGGISNAGNGTVTITNSTIANNFAATTGGGFSDENNGLGTLVVTNSTFVSNTAVGNGGGLFVSGPSTTINDSTISGNVTQGTGGGLDVTSPTFNLNNTIVAGNFSNGGPGTMNFSGLGPDVMGTVTAASTGNFIGIADTVTNIMNNKGGNIAGTAAAPLNADLGPLQNNGGPTLTEAPLLGSPVIDAGVNTAIPTGLATDQRGFLRIVGTTVDIGSVEFQPPGTTTTLSVGSPVLLGQPVGLTASVTAQSGIPNNPVTGTVTFFNGTTRLGTAMLTKGIATLTVPTLPAGIASLKAVFNGDFNFTTSTSAITTVRVNVRNTVGVFDPVTATWLLRNENTSGAPDAANFQFGAPGWFGLVGNWVGTGQETVAVVDPTTETWYIRTTNAPGAPDITPFQYGAPGWIPLAGDWTGTGHAGIGAFDPTTGTWYLRNEVGPGFPDAGTFRFGLPGDVPVVGDWTGTGHAGIGVVDLTTETWFLRNTPNGGTVDFTPFQYGAPGWKPVAGDWLGIGHTGIAVFDPTGTWYLKNNAGSGFPDFTPFAYGLGSWTPVAGNWNVTPTTGTMPPAARRAADSQANAALDTTFAQLADSGLASALVGSLTTHRHGPGGMSVDGGVDGFGS
jgi:hypothetical protein